MLIAPGYKFAAYSYYLSNNLAVGDRKIKFAALYSGTPPTQAQLLAAQTINGDIDWTKLRTALTDRALLAFVQTTKSLIAVRDGVDIARIPLGGIDIPATVAANGTPTWFIYGQLTSGTFGSVDTPETANGVTLGLCLTGKVSDLNGGGDVIVVGGKVDTTAGYTFMDITLKI